MFRLRPRLFIAFSVWAMVTKRLPKQIDPKEYVLARTKESLIAGEQKDDASNGLNHLSQKKNVRDSFSFHYGMCMCVFTYHVPTTPAVITRIIF